MNREIIKAVLPVLEAYSDNKIIQSDYGNGWKDIKTLTSACIGDCLVKGCCKLRIKPEPEYIPFTFEDAEQLIGKVIRPKNELHKLILLISMINFSGVFLEDEITITYTSLLSDYTFLDGSPCGKLKQ